MTLLSAHYKISSTKNKNPFEKQKVWKNGKEVKGELCNPVIYFSMEIATDEEPKDLLARVCHEWCRWGGNMLKVKELQSFKSKTNLCLFNVFTSTPKKNVLHEFCKILMAVQEMAQEMDPSEFFWDPLDLPSNSSIPALELRLINPKLPSQDKSQYNKLSWRAQANRKAYHLGCDCC
jgi:hypothetical protein